MIRPYTFAVLAALSGSLVSGCTAEEPASVNDTVESIESSLSAAQRRARATQIRDAAAGAGMTQGWMLAGIADAETGMAHCHSEATWACEGLNSVDCGGGPVIAGRYDGPCSYRQGGLGMFQFDAGTYEQTIARDGADILTVAGNVRRAVVFVTDMVIRSTFISGVDNPAQAVAWMNGVRVGNASWDAWISTVTRYYNGCRPTSSCWSSRYANYRDKTSGIYNEMGAAFWNDIPGRTCEARCDGTRIIQADCSTGDCAFYGVECLPGPVCGTPPPPEPDDAAAVAGVVLPSVAVDGAPSRFTFVTPRRLFDSRTPAESTDLTRGDGTTSGPLAAMSASIYRSASIPAEATGLWLNLASIARGEAGFVSVYPAGRSLPITSSVNVEPGAVRANSVPVPLGDGRGVAFYSRAETDAIADLNGVFTPTGGGLTSIPPMRVLDTRVSDSRLAADEIREIDIAAPSGSTGVVATLAVLPGAARGFLQALPCGSAPPNTSSINYAADTVTANNIVAPLVGGKLCVRSTTPVDLVVDVNGYISDAGPLSYQALTPTRLLDTRTSTTSFTGRLGRGQVIELPIQSLAGMPGFVWAVAANITALNADQHTFATVFPCGGGVPDTSSLNISPQVPVGALAVSQLGPEGTMCLFAHHRAHFIVDVVGVWVNDDSLIPPEPPPPGDDAGVPMGDDGGVSSDGGVFADGALSSDAEAPGAERPPADAGGCACATAPSGGSGSWSLLLLAGLALRRRRR